MFVCVCVYVFLITQSNNVRHANWKIIYFFALAILFLNNPASPLEESELQVIRHGNTRRSVFGRDLSAGYQCGRQGIV